MTERLMSRESLRTNVPEIHAVFRKEHRKLRIARLDEADAIVNLTKLAFRGRGNFSTVDFAQNSEVERLMAEGKFLVAEIDGAIAGYAYLKPSVEASQLELLAVSPEQQRTGIGSQLVEAAERISFNMQCSYMHVRVMNMNWDLLKFFRRRGYLDFAIESLQIQRNLSPHCHIVKMCKRMESGHSGF
jgi:ribosomal protein S18 acetylase RimI-like enzyme